MMTWKCRNMLEHRLNKDTFVILTVQLLVTIKQTAVLHTKSNFLVRGLPSVTPHIQPSDQISCKGVPFLHAFRSHVTRHFPFTSCPCEVKWLLAPGTANLLTEGTTQLTVHVALSVQGYHHHMFRREVTTGSPCARQVKIAGSSA